VDDQNEFVCFQIKGEWDLAEKDFLKTLKSQYFDSRKEYEQGFKDYYIVVCYSIVTDDKGRLVVDKKRQETVKAIIREFAHETRVRVIEPEYAAWFLSLSAIQIDALIKSRFGDEDIVYKEAIDLVSELGVTEKVILVFILWLQLYRNKLSVTTHEITQSPFMQRIHQMLADEAHFPIYDFDDQIAHDLEILENQFIERDSTGGFSLPIHSVQPLAILMMDGNIRYEHADEELLEYMLRVVGAFDLPNSE
jgi:hypothetical protein